MNDYIITCCSTADMPREHFIKRRIPYVCFHFMIDGKEYLDDLGESMSLDEFYTKIKNGAMPTTSQVNVSQFVDFFEPYLKIGLDILHISTSSGLSGEFNSANIAKNILKDKYPDRKIEVIDSISGSSGYGLLVDAAADLRDCGFTEADFKIFPQSVETNQQRLMTNAYYPFDLESEEAIYRKCY